MGDVVFMVVEASPVHSRVSLRVNKSRVWIYHRYDMVFIVFTHILFLSLVSTMTTKEDKEEDEYLSGDSSPELRVRGDVNGVMELVGRIDYEGDDTSSTWKMLRFYLTQIWPPRR